MPYDPTDPIVLLVEVEINGVWTDITRRSRAASCTITQGRTPSAATFEGSRLDLTIGNADGWLTEGNPASPWYPYIGRGCPIRVSIDDILPAAAPRFTGKIDSMRAVYPGGSDSSMEIVALGLLRQLAADTDVLRSAPYRYLESLTSPVPDASWPLEDSEEATYAQPLYGTQPMQPFVGTHPSGAVVTQPQFGRGTLAWWLPSVVSRSGSGDLTIIWGKVSQPSFSGTWVVDVAYTSTTDAPASNIDINPSYLGGVALWPQLIFNPVGRELQVTFNGLPEVNVPAKQLYDGDAHAVRWRAVQSGANVQWTVYLDGASLQTGTVTTYTLPAVSRIAHVAESGSGQLAIGYLNVWSTDTAASDFSNAVHGYAGDDESERLIRLCDDLGIPRTAIPAGRVPMGPIRPAELTDLFRETETAGQAILHDAGPGGVIGMATIDNILNRFVQLTITRGALETDVAPVWDNSDIRNDVTSSSPNGGRGHYADEDHVARVNRRLPESRTVNVESDTQLVNDAAWAVHTGTAAGPRYPSLGINLRNPDGAKLADTILDHQVGNRITVADAALPSQHPPGGIDVISVGWTEILDADTWRWRPNVVPYQPYELFEIGSQTRGRIAPDPFEVATAVSTTATSMLVKPTSPGAPLWITTAGQPGDFPFFADVAGEKQQVTAIASTVKDTFTRTASSGWGTSDTGQAWTTSGGAATDFSVGSGVGAILFSSAGVRKQAQVGPSYADVRVRAKVSPTVVATGAQIDQGITLRRDSAGDSAYEILLRFDTDSQVYLRINKVVTGAATTLLTQPLGLAYSAGSSFWLIADMVGSQMRIKVWPTTGNEPAIWRSFTDTAVTAAGQVGTCCRVQSGNTNVPVTPKWDDFELLSPQTFTVARSVNGVIKAQAAGNPVGLWKPTAIAL